VPTLTVLPRFCGPPGCVNGGYLAGLMGRYAGDVLTVRLERPVPVDTPLEMRTTAEGALELHAPGQRLASAQHSKLTLLPPPAPDYLAALEASRRYIGFQRHAFPACFVCGPERLRGDGLRIFAGSSGQHVAAPWVPDASLAEADGKVAPEFMTAALDCPGYFAARSDGVPMLLGEFTAHIDRRVHVDEPCVLVGWRLSVSGRKYEVGTALYDEDGEPCACARALWIEPRAASANSPTSHETRTR
jgi:hypothetical protein